MSEDPDCRISSSKLVFPHAALAPVSRLALGCMHFGGGWDPGSGSVKDDLAKAREALGSVLELGWTFFDHADIYCRGRSESVFAQAIRDLGVDRESVFIQTKCGIRFPGDPDKPAPHRFDFSREHILASVDGSLDRLDCGYIDILLLHRPDLLADPEEVILALDSLKESGKVRHFGVSNFTPPLLDLYLSAGFHPVANQVEINLLKTTLFDSTMATAEQDGRRIPAPGQPTDGTLEWHRRHGVVTQAWAPMAYGYLSGRDPDWEKERVSRGAEKVREIAGRHGVPAEAVVIGWLLRHPARIQPVVGSRNPARLKACHKALELNLSREEWYDLYVACRGVPLP